MNPPELKDRTKQFALRCLKLIDRLPAKGSARIISSQLGRSATSVAANYRAACRGRSRAEFVSKMGIVEEEVDESALWLELVIETGLKPQGLVAPLHREAEELTRIAVSSIKTARRSAKQSAIRNPQSAME